MLLVIILAITVAGEQAITVDVDLVNVFFTVSNKKGRLIPRLGPESFSVFEDGSEQNITHFSRETEVPLSIVLMVDTSGSVRDKLGFEQQAALSFFHSTLTPGRDKAAVLTFDSGVDLRQDYTDDCTLLAKAVLHTIAGGGTRLYDAVALAVSEKLSQSSERKVIILLTDGRDNKSATTLEEAIEAAHHEGVIIYAVSTNGFGIQLDPSDSGNKALDVLSRETGGQAFFPAGLKELPADFARIGEELRSQYTLGYRSTNDKKDGTFRSIQIAVRNGHYAVRARSGYYAPVPAPRKTN